MFRADEAASQLPHCLAWAQVTIPEWPRGKGKGKGQGRAMGKGRGKGRKATGEAAGEDLGGRDAAEALLRAAGVVAQQETAVLSDSSADASAAIPRQETDSGGCSGEQQGDGVNAGGALKGAGALEGAGAAEALMLQVCHHICIQSGSS